MAEAHHDGVLSWLAEGRVFVNVWTATPTGRHIDAVRTAQLAAYRENGKLGVITILRPRAVPRFDEDMRRASAHARRTLEPSYACSAFLIDEAGFLGAAVRSVLSGVHALSRADYPTKVFSDLFVAAQWTSEHLVNAGCDVDPERIVVIVQRVRLHLEEPA
jgi:hypothetical protein